MDNDPQANANDECAETTEHLIERARVGESEAFSRLVARFHQRVLRYVQGLVHDREVADDVAQEVFLAAYQSLNQFNNQSEFSTWLLGIARNKAISTLRRIVAQRRREDQATSHLIASWRLDYLERTDEEHRSGQLDALRDCLRKLKPQHRELLQRHYRDNETAESIAKEIGRSGSGIRMLFLRLRKTLHECMNRDQAIE